jgi:hypothetical protein
VRGEVETVGWHINSASSERGRMATGGLRRGGMLQVGDERFHGLHGMAKAEWAGGWWVDSKNES